ncbi:ParB/RepB/Spo0J family partition protein [Nonomuraea angiospora]|uniref:ParB/RepB/Spo0J family partition protein n=1 Tax=Nonomuraea angiospora TaxID=46172 RepID=UPI0029A7C58C|nr:ParB/RepB/Spo0J family partition protein [Nonomuraea angiospora]MDX3100497.1 ParB/RepB/Spo0J family partition protein [Nonomuraea angiospora]
MSTPTGPKIVARTIPVSQIQPDPAQPREHFDEEKLQELAKSMQALGQLESIAVREGDQPGTYILIAGERRWRAAQIAEIPKLRANVHVGIADGDPKTLAKQVAENVARADMTPMEEAKAFQRLVDAGFQLEEVAVMCGKSVAYVGWRIDLLALAPAVQDAVSKGHMPVGLAWYVAQLAHDNQVRFLSRWVRGDFPTKRDAEAFAQACAQEEKRQADQGAMFVLAEAEQADQALADDGPEALFADLSVDERDRVADERKKLLAKIDRMSEIGTVLAEIATMEPAELALLLAGAPGGLAAQRQRLDHLKDLTMKANKTLREAQAVASVRAGSTKAPQDATSDSTESNAA